MAEGAEAERRVEALLDQVHLPARTWDALPGALSSGERQRAAIARALAPRPVLLVCDEPVASVDAATRELLLDLLDTLRREEALAMVLISHDLAAVRHIATRIAVMYLGRIVELGDAATGGRGSGWRLRGTGSPGRTWRRSSRTARRAPGTAAT
jgi:ABC-type glutathione transport system ATPase component